MCGMEASRSLGPQAPSSSVSPLISKVRHCAGVLTSYAACEKHGFRPSMAETWRGPLLRSRASQGTRCLGISCAETNLGLSLLSFTEYSSSLTIITFCINSDCWKNTVSHQPHKIRRGCRLCVTEVCKPSTCTQGRSAILVTGKGWGGQEQQRGPVGALQALGMPGDSAMRWALSKAVRT